MGKLRAVAVIVLVLGLALLGYGISQRLSLPPEPQMPTHEGFLEGQITIGDVQRQNHEWFELSRARAEQSFRAFSLMIVGVFLSVVGAANAAGLRTFGPRGLGRPLSDSSPFGSSSESGSLLSSTSSPFSDDPMCMHPGDPAHRMFHATHPGMPDSMMPAESLISTDKPTDTL